MGNNKKKHKVNITQNLLGSITAASVMIGGLGLAVAGTSGADLLLLPSELASSLAFVENSEEYQAYQNNALDLVYNDFRNGKIDYEEFDKRCKEVKSREALFVYARNSDDEAVKKILDHYDDIRKKSERLSKAGVVAISAGAAGVVGCLLADLDRKKERKRQELCEEMSM